MAIFYINLFTAPLHLFKITEPACIRQFFVVTVTLFPSEMLHVTNIGSGYCTKTSFSTKLNEKRAGECFMSLCIIVFEYRLLIWKKRPCCQSLTLDHSQLEQYWSRLKMDCKSSLLVESNTMFFHYALRLSDSIHAGVVWPPPRPVSVRKDVVAGQELRIRYTSWKF